METSKQLFARRRELADKQHDLMKEEMVDEARVIEGQIAELDRTIEHVLDEEERLRDEFKAAPEPKGSFGERILGARDAFKGIEVGFKNDAEAAPVVHVAGPQEIELALPAKRARLLANFAATLPSAPAQGSVAFKQRGPQTGAVGSWAGVDAYTGESALKEKVLYSWIDAVANKETFAGYVPVSKDTLLDYDELLAIIEQDLLQDLAEVENTAYLTGNNASGVIGVLNQVGIQSFTTHMGGKYWEAIRMMRTEVMENARTIPTHVCMHPDIKQAIDLYKDDNDRYQLLDNFWGMEVVEDFDCSGILVYDAYAARKRPIHGVSVEVGYVNDQFVKNELSVLAERTSALQVIRPDAFCYATKANLDA